MASETLHCRRRRVSLERRNLNKFLSKFLKFDFSWFLVLLDIKLFKFRAIKQSGWARKGQICTVETLRRPCETVDIRNANLDVWLATSKSLDQIQVKKIKKLVKLHIIQLNLTEQSWYMFYSIPSEPKSKFCFALWTYATLTDARHS